MEYIRKENGSLAYKKMGNGPRVLLAFHGFGQNHQIFQPWSKKLKKFTFYAFDLFYHGESTRTYGKLSKQEWFEFLSNFLEKEKINKFSVLGYSLGGRFAIASAIGYSAKIEEVILVAPDGIFLTVWFKLATTPVIKWLFKYFMVNPDKLENLIKTNERLRLANKYIADFARKEMAHSDNRKRVYLSWNHFKALGYSKKALIKQFTRTSFKRTIVLGEDDRIIKPNKILPIIHKMGGFEIIRVNLKHHQLINPDVANLIAKRELT